MTDLYSAACSLSDNLSDKAYLWVEPETLDFTVHAEGKIIIESRGRVEIDVNRDNVANVAGLLQATVFDKTVVPMLFCYNIKPLMTYFRYYLQRDTIPSTSVIDLKIIENFLNLNRKRPENLAEVVNRSKALSQYKSWAAVYKKIHLPFAFKVLPSIETTPLLDEADKLSKYPYYEIEGQTNGRLNCLKKFHRAYLPHNLGPDQRQTLKPRAYGHLFMLADYKHCEVTVLQWLSKDEVLKEIINSGEDLYSVAYRIITGDECDTPRKRDISKIMLLRVMYGLGAKGLSAELSIANEKGVELVNRIQRKFSVASQWMQKQQDIAQQRGHIVDYFGRPRRFEDGKFYLARNFAVQGVAWTACAEKVIQLQNALKETDARICFTVHDGYVLTSPYEEAKKVYMIVKETLESESTMCPGLNMKVEVKYGKRLSEMKPIKGEQ